MRLVLDTNTAVSGLLRLTGFQHDPCFHVETLHDIVAGYDGHPTAREAELPRGRCQEQL